MSDLLTDTLPTVWHGRHIDPDFRHMVWLSNVYRRGAEEDPLALACRAVRRFYCEPQPLLNNAQACMEAYQHLIEFYIAGEQAAEPTSNDAASGPDKGPTFDYRCDAPYIVAAFQQAYGIDLTTAKLHWFRFRALFAALPEDTLMAKIMSWRTMDLSEYEGSMRDRYADLQERFALPAELRGGAARVVSVEEHDAAFLARFRH